MRQFDIIGAGMGTRETLTGEAAQALASAEMVFATERLAEICENAQICLFSELAERAIACGADRAALLVSGDVGFFSAAGKLREKLLAHGEVRLFCGLSSMQYLCAKIGISYENACIRSLHGRKGDLLGAVSYHEKTFALTGGDNNAQFVCRSLADAGEFVLQKGDEFWVNNTGFDVKSILPGLGGVQVYIGENLGSPGERVLKGTASELAENPCADLAVMLVLNPNSVNPFEPVRDEMLTRAKVPMTKEEVRWVSVARLGVQPGDTVWDVGAGTGAVTFELARKAMDGAVFAVERNTEAIELIAQNRQKLGGFNVHIVQGHAPEVLADLPKPNCVFVGGSGGNMREIIKIALMKNPEARIAVNAIALETLQETQRLFAEFGLQQVEITQLSAARGKSIGCYTMMTANNPVFILSGKGAKYGE